MPEKEEQVNKVEDPVEVTQSENATNASESASEPASESAPNPASESPSEEVVPTETNETPTFEESTEAPEQAEAEEQEDAEQKPEIKIETAPADFRFPTTNQTRHCFTRYIEYHRCTAAKGEGAPECDKFAKYYRSLCPGEWIDRWNEQRENGTFPGPL